jgi:lipid-A-disaccharide synthase-like uncharacterized protein
MFTVIYGYLIPAFFQHRYLVAFLAVERKDIVSLCVGSDVSEKYSQ